MTKEEIGRILKGLRTSCGLTQKEVAEKLGRKQQIVGHWETGYAQPDANTLFTLCDIYGITVDDAFGFHKNNAISPSEYEHIKKYRDLDSHGKEMVDFTLLKEWERSTADPKPENKTSSATAEIIPMRFLSYYQRMASAGRGEYLFSDIPTEVIAVPDTPLSRKADFVIGVSGRSMEDTYFDGDKVLVEKTHNVPIGEIGIFIRETECFIKEVGENRLISHNKNKEQYPDIIPDERRIDTIGIVLGKVGE